MFCHCKNVSLSGSDNVNKQAGWAEQSLTPVFQKLFLFGSHQIIDHQRWSSNVDLFRWSSSSIGRHHPLNNEKERKGSCITASWSMQATLTVVVCFVYFLGEVLTNTPPPRHWCSNSDIGWDITVWTLAVIITAKSLIWHFEYLILLAPLILKIARRTTGAKDSYSFLPSYKF